MTLASGFVCFVWESQRLVKGCIHTASALTYLVPLSSLLDSKQSKLLKYL